MTNTKCTILGCRYAEVSLSLERMREDFHTVQNGAIELAQEYNSKIAALEARCREQQEALREAMEWDWLTDPDSIPKEIYSRLSNMLLMDRFALETP